MCSIESLTFTKCSFWEHFQRFYCTSKTVSFWSLKLCAIALPQSVPLRIQLPSFHNDHSCSQTRSNLLIPRFSKLQTEVRFWKLCHAKSAAYNSCNNVRGYSCGHQRLPFLFFTLSSYNTTPLLLRSTCSGLTTALTELSSLLLQPFFSATTLVLFLSCSKSLPLQLFLFAFCRPHLVFTLRCFLVLLLFGILLTYFFQHLPNSFRFSKNTTIE